MNAPASLKSALRKEKIALRLTIGEAVRRDFSHVIVQRLMQQLDRGDSAIALYHPMRGEVDILTLAEQERNFCLPAITAQGRELIFHEFTLYSPLVKDKYGILHPEPHTPLCTPDVVIVPVVAFDRQGYRIGYGGGYYDATLAALRAGHKVRAIGVAFSCQEVALVPREPFDMQLDAILTEKESIIL